MKYKTFPSYYMFVIMGRLLLRDGKRVYGSELAECGVGPGNVYMLLHRMEREGILTAEKETAIAKELGRPPRTYYRLTERGRRYAVAYNAATIAANPPLVRFSEFT